VLALFRQLVIESVNCQQDSVQPIRANSGEANVVERQALGTSRSNRAISREVFRPCEEKKFFNRIGQKRPYGAFAESNLCTACEASNQARDVRAKVVDRQ
jgi:hypothetical protein